MPRHINRIALLSFMLYLVSILTTPSILSDHLASAATSENQRTDALRMFTIQDSLKKHATFWELVCSKIKRTFVGRIFESRSLL